MERSVNCGNTRDRFTGRGDSQVIESNESSICFFLFFLCFVFLIQEATENTRRAVGQSVQEKVMFGEVSLTAVHRRLGRNTKDGRLRRNMRSRSSRAEACTDG